MPLYKIACECGSTEAYQRARADWGDGVACNECGAVCPVLFAPANFASVADRPITLKQVGRTFANAAELDKWAASNGCEVVSRGSTTWRGQVEDAREGANELASTMGFNDVEEQRAKEKEDPTIVEERTRSAVARNIDKYHTLHGSDEKQTVDQVMESNNVPS